MGGGTSLNLKVYASGSHSAIHCQVVHSYTCTSWYTDTCNDWYEEECDGGYEDECPGTMLRESSDYFPEDGTDCWGYYYECSYCHIGDWTSYGCYGGKCQEYITIPCEHGSASAHKIKVACEHGYKRDHTITVKCYHGHTKDHTQTDHLNCSYSNPCTNGHTSFRTIDHYYCTTHNYVGTSSTCPGLTLNPRPSPLTLYYGQQQTITPNQQPSSASVSYTSSDTNVATVSSTGVVTSKKKGNTQITVTGVI